MIEYIPEPDKTRPRVRQWPGSDATVAQSLHASPPNPALQSGPLEGRLVSPAQARLAIGGPAEGQVIRSNSQRLDYRQPTVTVTFDVQTTVERDARPLFTYVQGLIPILDDFRFYHVWASEEWLDETDAVDQERELLLLLVDADPKETWPCIYREPKDPEGYGPDGRG